MLPGWVGVNDAENNVVCALQGCGIVQLPRFHVEADLHAGRLVELLPEFGRPALPLRTMYPYRTHLSPRVRVFVEWVGRLCEQRFGPMAAAVPDLAGSRATP